MKGTVTYSRIPLGSFEETDGVFSFESNSFFIPCFNGTRDGFKVFFKDMLEKIESFVGTEKYNDTELRFLNGDY
jgi:hypothetical protein